MKELGHRQRMAGTRSTLGEKQKKMRALADCMPKKQEKEPWPGKHRAGMRSALLEVYTYLILQQHLHKGTNDDKYISGHIEYQPGREHCPPIPPAQFNIQLVRVK